MIPPKIDSTLTKNPLTAKTGESITVTLIVIGDPAPRVDWYVNGKIILPGTPRFNFSRQGPKHQLLVQPVTSKEDVIRVVARNWLGMDTYDQRVSFYKVLRKYSIGSTGSTSSLSQAEIAPAEKAIVHRGKLQLRGGASMPVLNILPAYRSSTSFLNRKGTSSTLVPKKATLDDDELFEPLNKVSRTQSNKETRSHPRHQITLQSASLPRSASTYRNRDCVDYNPVHKHPTQERRTQSVSQLGSSDVSVALPSPPPVKMNASPPEKSMIRKSMELIPQSGKRTNKQGLASPKALTNKSRHKSEGELRTPKSSPSHKEISYATENELELQIETFFTPLEASQSSLGLYKPQNKPQTAKITTRSTHLPDEVFGTNGIEKYIINHEAKKQDIIVKKSELNNNNNPAYKDQERDSLSKDMTNNNICPEESIKKETTVTVQSTIQVGDQPVVKPKGVTFAKYGKFCDDFESFKVEQKEANKERRTSSPTADLDDSFCLDDDPASVFDELEKAASPTVPSGAEVEAAAFRPSTLHSQQTNEGFLETDIDDLIMNIDSPSRERSIKKKNNILHSDSDEDDDLSTGSLEVFAKDIEHKERVIVHANRPVSFRVPNSEYFRPTIVETILEEDTQMLEEENENNDEMKDCSSLTDNVLQNYGSSKLSSSFRTKAEDHSSLISGSDIRKTDIQESNKKDVCNSITTFGDNRDLGLRGNGCVSPKINSSSEEELDTYVDILSNIPAMNPQQNKPKDSVKEQRVSHLTVTDENLNSSSSDIDMDMDSYMVYLASKNENTHKSTAKNRAVPLSNSCNPNEKPLETDIDSVSDYGKTELSSVGAVNANNELNIEASQNTSVNSSDSGYSSFSSQNTKAQQLHDRNVTGLENKNNSNGSIDSGISKQGRPLRNQNGSVSPGGASQPGSSSRPETNETNPSTSSNSLPFDHRPDQKNFLVTENNWEAVTEVFWSNIWSFLLLLTALVIVHLLNPYFTASESTW